jgi:hypothetical protein
MTRQSLAVFIKVLGHSTPADSRATGVRMLDLMGAYLDLNNFFDEVYIQNKTDAILSDRFLSIRQYFTRILDNGLYSNRLTADELDIVKQHKHDFDNPTVVAT